MARVYETFDDETIKLIRAAGTGVRRAKGEWLRGDYVSQKDSDGKIRRQHILVAEKKLGRKLLPNEVVHHKDGDKLNNTPNNLAVMEAGAHSYLHCAVRYNLRCRWKQDEIKK